LSGRWLTPGDGPDGRSGYDDERRLVLTNLRGAGRRKREHHELRRLAVALLDQLRAVTVVPSVDEDGALVGPLVMMRRHTRTQRQRESDEEQGLKSENRSCAHETSMDRAGRRVKQGRLSRVRQAPNPEPRSA
jgi:hypothetical protein